MNWKWICFYCLSAFFVLTGTLMVFFWQPFYHNMLNKQLSLADCSTYQYQYWQETPMDIITKIYLFNWTNSDNYTDDGDWVKPRFQEVGPYTFAERHHRADVVFNENGTISFKTVRTWHFKPDQSNGSLDDYVTTFHPIALSIANIARDYPFIIRRAVHYFLTEYVKSIKLTKTVDEFTFTGIQDIMIDVARKLNLKKFEVPYDKLGWFYDRNNSAAYDGNYTMWTGADNIQNTGIVTEWNQANLSKAFCGECARIDGTTGEVWYPVKDAESVSMFLSDTCSKLTLVRNGSVSSKGILSNYYVATEKMFDNGSIYPEMSCFSAGEVLPSGVRDISLCKFNAPVYISLAHFTLADPWYTENIDGLQPDPDKYKMSLAIEPNLGLPLDARISFQANILLRNASNISLFENVNETMIPILWVSVSAGVPDNFVSLINLALAGPTIGLWVGYVLILVGLIMVFSPMLITLIQKKCK